MSGDTKKLTIVYQFGKVASTSLVNTLAANPSLDVHQSHFLGESALQRIVPIAVDRATNAYFHEHLCGQLMANVRLTYRMNQVLAGSGPANLKVISLSREPLDWLRSGVLQDIDGYRDDLVALARDAGCNEDEEAALYVGLVEALSRIGDIFDRKGGVTEAVRLFHEIGGKAMLEPDGPGADMIVRRLFFLALRPLTWFEEHFQSCFGVSLSDFTNTDGVWTTTRPRADFVLLRYEDLSEKFNAAMGAIGLHVSAPLQRDNVSRTKPFANVVSDAFASDKGEALRKRLLASDYAQYFNYGSAEVDSVAAE